MFNFLYELLAPYTSSPTSNYILELFIKILTCIVVLCSGLFASFVLRRLIKNFFLLSAKNLSKSNSLDSSVIDKKSDTISTVLRSVVKYVAWFFIICQILSIFGVRVESILAVAGIGSIAIGFGAQSLVKDFIIGVSILLEGQFHVGDVVTIEGRTGTVEAIGIRTTKIRSFDGDLHIFPNSEIKIVTNMSRGFKRAIVDVEISYSTELKRVLDILEEEIKVVSHMAGLISEPQVLGITELGENTIKIRIIADCHVGESWAIERQIRRLIKLRFEKDNIPPPHPQYIVNK